MKFFRRIRADFYLKKFVQYCKESFGENLIAVVVFGSYVEGYFDRKESDYDVFVILKNGARAGSFKKKVNEKFKKVALQYLMTEDELLRRAHFGHFTSYISLLRGGRAIHASKDYRNFLKRLKKINLFEELVDVVAIEAKTFFEIGVLEKNEGYKAVKWALPMIRKRLQLLSYLRRRKLIWELKKNLKLNRDLFAPRERKFIWRLWKKVLKRSEDFDEGDKEMTRELVSRINREIVLHLGDLAKR